MRAGNHLTKYLVPSNYCCFLDRRWLFKIISLVEICKMTKLCICDLLQNTNGEVEEAGMPRG